MHDTYGANPRLLPESLHESYGEPTTKLPRIPTRTRDELGGRGEGQDGSVVPIRVRRALTETMLLGVVALRAGTKIDYDGANMRITNVAAANQYLTGSRGRAGLY